MFIIAEIGTSHGGNINKAKKLIDCALNAGADAVKFQWVYADEILHPNTGYVTLPGGKIRLYDKYKELEVSPSFFLECKEYAKSKKIKFICTPFGLKSLKELVKINPDYIKIASPELNHIPLLKSLANIRKEKDIPIIISSGVSTLNDIEKALSILGNRNITLLHCVTFYPAPEEEYNLKVLKTLSEKFNIPVGVSDHSLNPVLVPALSFAMGGTMIEKHITLSKTTDGLDDPVALTEEQFSQMCFCINQCKALLKRYEEKGIDLIIQQMKDEFSNEVVNKVLGSGEKKLAPIEEQNYGRTNRSLHFMRDMQKGELIKESDIGILRTEKELTPGISPEFYDSVINRTLTRDISAGEGVQLKDYK